MSEELTMYEIVAAGLVNPELRGPYVDQEGRMMLDRRYTETAMQRYGLSPRTADFSLIGPEQVAVPEELKAVAEAVIKARRAAAVRAIQPSVFFDGWNDDESDGSGGFAH